MTQCARCCICKTADTNCFPVILKSPLVARGIKFADQKKCIVFAGFAKSIPLEIDEAAAIDG